MKIYTIQKINFLEQPILKPSKSDKSIFTNETTISALNLMKKTFSPDCPELIWVWPDIKYIDPIDISEDECVYVFEVPKSEYKKILWSDFIEWHMPLNGFTNYKLDDLFQVNPLKPKGKVIQGVTDHLDKKWFLKRLKLNSSII